MNLAEFRVLTSHLPGATDLTVQISGDILLDGTDGDYDIDYLKITTCLGDRRSEPELFLRVDA